MSPNQERTDWLYHELTDLREQLRENHSRLRADMNLGFSNLAAEMHDGFARIDARAEHHSGRLTIIETERGMEKSQALRRGTWAGLVSAGGFMAVWKAAEHFFFGPG